MNIDMARRIRNFLALRQNDIEAGTGIPRERISNAENGRIRLNHIEEVVLQEYLESHLRAFLEEEGVDNLFQLPQLRQ